MYTCVAVAVVAVIVVLVNGAPLNNGLPAGEVDQMRKPRPTADNVIGHYPIKMILDLLNVDHAGLAPYLRRARKDRKQEIGNELLKLQLQALLYEEISQFPIKMHL
ncbi:uncharacterized protein LOC124133897 [Haliotis rufescens]|uniref:uncharacterized protein LOC124133897 n=1 Tax=Haliotis rufescens TaxID=6454 RepID=UPI00201ECB03|nr:uncharacterized protein LOC124133897 [Haliotis rufescens]